MSGSNNRVIDQRLVKAIAHPLRVEILEAFVADGELSPVLISKRLEQPIGNVSYHVNVLRDCEVIELSSTRQRRGALEHFFRPAPTVRNFIELARTAFGTEKVETDGGAAG
jgi:DNA-binding transcriptional ArsR family regulator